MTALFNAAYLDGTGYVDDNGQWKLVSQATPLPVYVVESAVITEIDYNGGTNATYIGVAPTGTAVSATGWQIKFLTYDVNNNPLTIAWANTGATNLIWNNRASYSYS